MWKTGIFLGLFSLIAFCSFSQNDFAKNTNSVSQTEIESLAANQYKQFLSTHTNITSPRDNDLATVKKVSHNIVLAIKTYYKNQYDKNEEINKIDWEIRLIDKKEANVWCMPGGKMAVYNGLLASTQSESSLAILLSHVTAHALLKHGNERMDNWLSDKLKEKSLKKALAERFTETTELFLAAFGIGTNAGVWAPFSKKQEIAADRLALQISMLAGYKPRESVVFWTRMGFLIHSPQQPEFMSMHLTDESRIKKLEDYIDELNEINETPIKKN
jgi:predicted Zn-dependent protease